MSQLLSQVPDFARRATLDSNHRPSAPENEQKGNKNDNVRLDFLAVSFRPRRPPTSWGFWRGGGGRVGNGFKPPAGPSHPASPASAWTRRRCPDDEPPNQLGRRSATFRAGFLHGAAVVAALLERLDVAPKEKTFGGAGASRHRPALCGAFSPGANAHDALARHAPGTPLAAARPPHSVLAAPARHLRNARCARMRRSPRCLSHRPGHRSKTAAPSTPRP